MQTLTGIGGILAAAHHDRVTGAVHGHSWEITAWFDTSAEHMDAPSLQRSLDALIAELDHRLLPGHLAHGEDIARWIMEAMNADLVEVRRPLERIYARVAK